MERLDEVECRQLLESTRVGRLGYIVDGVPHVVPMNFVLVAGNLLLRTAADNEVARNVLDRPVAFEVDEVEEFFQAGWSVLVTGTGRELPAEALRHLDVGQTPDPWPEGLRSLVLQIVPETISGRRVHAA